MDIFDATARGARVFVESFYDVFDSRRLDAAKLYTDAAKLVWNGHAHLGRDAISAMFQTLPSSKHSILSFDCQPMLASNEKMMILIVTGQVTYGDKESHTFTQDFMLVARPVVTPQGQTKEVFFISNDSFRFV